MMQFSLEAWVCCKGSSFKALDAINSLHVKLDFEENR